MATREGHEPYWDLIKRIIIESDLVLEILDARLVEVSRNKEVERLIEEIGRPMIFVINKSDLVSSQSLEKPVQELKKKGEVVFVSSKNPKTVKVLLYVIKKVFDKFGKREKVERGKYDPKPKYREALGEIVVGVLGYPNVGKSSVINALAHKKKVKVSKKSGTTHGVHWIKATSEIKLIDSPGVIPLNQEDEIRYGLIGAKDTEALKDPELVAHAVVKLFLKYGKKKFEEFYKINVDSKDVKGKGGEKGVEDIVEEIGFQRGFLVKGGKVDENRVVSLIVRDWQQGRLRL